MTNRQEDDVPYAFYHAVRTEKHLNYTVIFCVLLLTAEVFGWLHETGYVN